VGRFSASSDVREESPRQMIEDEDDDEDEIAPKKVKKGDVLDFLD
jgi:hypothetical protein